MNKTIKIYTFEQLKKCVKNFKYCEPKFQIIDKKYEINDFYKIEPEILDIKVIEEENDEEIFNSIVKFEKLKFNKIIKFESKDLPKNFFNCLKINNENHNIFEFFTSYKREKFFNNLKYGWNQIK